MLLGHKQCLRVKSMQRNLGFLKKKKKKGLIKPDLWFVENKHPGDNWQMYISICLGVIQHFCFGLGDIRLHCSKVRVYFQVSRALLCTKKHIAVLVFKSAQEQIFCNRLLSSISHRVHFKRNENHDVAKCFINHRVAQTNFDPSFQYLLLILLTL